MSKSARMVCPTCGLTMNHHAEKLDLTIDPGEAKHVDPELGAVLREVHTCPGCGESATREIVPPPSAPIRRNSSRRDAETQRER